MSSAFLESLFPRLSGSGYRVTSAQDSGYNCIAHALSDSSRWWEPFRPDGHWPQDVPLDDSVEGLAALYRRFGFEDCDDGSLRDGYEKVVIYGLRGSFTHVARQLPGGTWTSKLGELEDIEHATLDGLTSSDYGAPTRFLWRRRDVSSSSI